MAGLGCFFLLCVKGVLTPQVCSCMSCSPPLRCPFVAVCPFRLDFLLISFVWLSVSKRAWEESGNSDGTRIKARIKHESSQEEDKWWREGLSLLLHSFCQTSRIILRSREDAIFLSPSSFQELLSLQSGSRLSFFPPWWSKESLCLSTLLLCRHHFLSFSFIVVLSVVQPVSLSSCLYKWLTLLPQSVSLDWVSFVNWKTNSKCRLRFCKSFARDEQLQDDA